MPATMAAIASGGDRLGRHDLGEAGVHLGGGGAELAGRSEKSAPVADGAERDPPGVLGAGEELLREGEVAARPGPRRRDRRPGRRDGADHGRARAVEPASASAPCTHDVGVLTGLQGAEDLADQRFRRGAGLVDAVEDDRGVGLLAGQDLREPVSVVASATTGADAARRRLRGVAGAPGLRGGLLQRRGRAAVPRRPGRGSRRRPSGCRATLCSMVPTRAC